MNNSKSQHTVVKNITMIAVIACLISTAIVAQHHVQVAGVWDMNTYTFDNGVQIDLMSAAK